MIVAAEESDVEHATRPDETLAANETMDGESTEDSDDTVEAEAPALRERILQRSSRRRHNNLMTQALLAAISTGQLGAVCGAASLRMRGRRVPTITGPRSQLSQSLGAPKRIVSVASLSRPHGSKGSHNSGR